MNEARIRIGSKSAAGYEIELWDSGFPLPADAPISSGMIPSAHFDPARTAPILDAIRNQLTTGPDFRTAGQHLFDAMVAVEGKWKSLRQQGCRTYLQVDDSELTALPWELAGFPQTGSTFPRLFTAPGAPISRVHPVPLAGPPPLAMDATLRMLLLPGEPLTDDDHFPSNEFCTILREIQPCPHSMHVEVADTLPAGPDDIRVLLNAVRPHIVHFLGHGEVSPYTGYPALVFNSPAGKWWWDSDAVFQLLNNHPWVPRLVVLNACHSAAVAGMATDMAPVAGSLALAGVPAIAAMQATVRIDRSQEFSEALYRSLVRHGQLDVAFAEARNALGNADPAGWSRRDWALPILSLSVPPDQVMKNHPFPPEVANCPILGQFQSATGPAAFVGRSIEKRKVLGALKPFDAAEQPTTCLLVEGPSESGKSWLVYRCARDIAAAGVLVRHVDLTASQAYDSLGLMDRVLSGADENPISLVHSPLPLATFHDYQQKAASYRAGTKDLVSLSRATQAWYVGLKKLAEDNHMLLILDQLRGSNGGISPEEFKLALLKDFVVPIANAPQSPILLIIVVRPGDAADYGLSIPRARSVILDRLAPSIFGHLFREFCRFKVSKKLGAVQELYSLTKAEEPWSPSLFTEVAKWVEGLI